VHFEIPHVLMVVSCGGRNTAAISGAWPGNSARVDQLVGLKAPDRTPVDQLVPKGSRAFA
jgi:hypothetical protein